jgi:hypothetical protein
MTSVVIGGRRDKDDRKQKTLAPLIAGNALSPLQVVSVKNSAIATLHWPPSSLVPPWVHFMIAKNWPTYILYCIRCLRMLSLPRLAKKVYAIFCVFCFSVGKLQYHYSLAMSDCTPWHILIQRAWPIVATSMAQFLYMKSRAGHSLIFPRFAIRSPLNFFPWIADARVFIFLISLFARRSNARRSTSGSLSDTGINHSSLSISQDVDNQQRNISW